MVTLFCLSSYLPDPNVAARLHQQNSNNLFKATQAQKTVQNNQEKVETPKIIETLQTQKEVQKKIEAPQVLKKTRENIDVPDEDEPPRNVIKRPEKLPSIDEIRDNFNKVGGDRDSCMIQRLGQDRDYFKFPVIVRSSNKKYEYEKDCDIPCLYTSTLDFPYVDASTKFIPGTNSIIRTENSAVCNGHHQKAMMSMESVLNYPSLKRESLKKNGFDIQGIYDLNSDVPLPYFSWAEYDIYKKPVKKVYQSKKKK